MHAGAMSRKRPLSPTFYPDVLDLYWKEPNDRRPASATRVGKMSSMGGFIKTLRALKESRFEPLDKMLDMGWWKKNVAGAQSFAAIRCSECGYEPPRCTLSNLCRLKSANCFCNGGGLWASDDGHKRFLHLIDNSRHLSALDFTRSPEWWNLNVKGFHSKVPFKCNLCQHVCTRTRLNNFSRGRVACLCGKKTQMYVTRFIEDVCFDLDEVEVIIEYNNIEALENKRMKFDVAVVKCGTCVLLVEIDGEQHFDANNWMHSKELQLRDVVKENAARLSKVPIVRLYQPDVYEDRFDWKKYLHEKVLQAIEGTLPPFAHYQPGCSLYASGEFARLRLE